MRQVEWPEMPAFIFWNKLKTLRKTLKLTIADVATGVGVAISTIAFCEKGHENIVSEKIKRRIADYFDVEYEDLFPCEMEGTKVAGPHPKKAKGPIKVQAQFFEPK